MKNLNRIHLNALKAAEAVLRLGTLAAAAAELGVTTGAVSQHVIRCERQLGRKLFTRDRRGLTPTPFATRIAGPLHEGFSRLDEAAGRAFHAEEDALTISVAPVFAAKWLVPRLARFGRLEPETKLRLDASVTLVHPDNSDIDLAIRVGPGDWPGVRAEFLLPQEVFPVCTPALAARLESPRDILSAPVVRDANTNISWDLWLKQFGLDAGAMRAGNSFTDAALCLDAAIAGQGVMLAWQTLAHDALKAGLLTAPFPERAETPFGYWLVTSATRPETARVRRFKAWLRAELAESFAPDTGDRRR